MLRSCVECTVFGLGLGMGIVFGLTLTILAVDCFTWFFQVKYEL